MAKAHEHPPSKGKDCAAYQRGYKLYQHGDLESARDAFLESISEDFANADAWAMLANIYADMDEPEHAAEASRQAVRSDLNNPEWRVLRAQHVQLCHKLEEARAEFDKAIELDPEFVPAWFNRALLEAEEGKDAAALADLRKAVELNPGAWDMIDNYEIFDRLRAMDGFPPEPAGLDQAAQEEGDAPDNPFMQLKLPQDDDE